MYVNLIQHEGELKDVVLTARIYSGQGDAITEAIKDLATEIVQAEQVKEYIVHDTFPRGEAAANPGDGTDTIHGNCSARWTSLTGEYPRSSRGRNGRSEVRLRQETEGPQEEYGLTPDRVSSNLDTVKDGALGSHSLGSSLLTVCSYEAALTSPKPRRKPSNTLSSPL